ncbi:putative G-protein coupled receptor [Merluccius polli]|uniref:G-protein coupled receptor n=1 Tax=Merluccius polli TaxID=89951 RepID=A0AA47PC28_MERPO|nr:putative G-protein coupled receptor [Merluccius polli]
MEEVRLLLAPQVNNESTAPWAPAPSAAGRQLGAAPGAQTRFKDLSGIFFMVALNVLALLANTAVIVVILKAPHLRKFAFVCHLCAVDLLCGVLLMPLGVVCSSPYFSGMVFTVLECQVYIFLNVFLIAASIFTITAISVERYYYIVHPMRYEVKMTCKLTAAVVALVWLASAALGLATVFGWPPYGSRSSISAARCSLHWSHSGHRRVFSLLFCVICFCAPAVVIFAVYCNVYKVARVAARQHGPLPSWTPASQMKSRSDSINSQTTIITTCNAPRRSARDRPFGGSKAALTLVVIVGQFLICWLPYFAFHLHLTLDTSSAIPVDLKDTVTWLAYSSFALNPFFYGLLNRQIREELGKLRRCYSARPTELFLSSHEASGHENFLQFLHRTSCTVDTRASFTASSPRNTVDQTTQPGFRIPGQIPEELN